MSNYVFFGAVYALRYLMKNIIIMFLFLQNIKYSIWSYFGIRYIDLIRSAKDWFLLECSTDQHTNPNKLPAKLPRKHSFMHNI